VRERMWSPELIRAIKELREREDPLGVPDGEPQGGGLI